MAMENQYTWGVYAIFNPNVKNQLDSALHDEIDQAISKGVTTDELDKSKRSLMEYRKTLLGLDNYLAYQQLDYLKDGRDLNEITDFENKINALSLESVNAALKKYFDPSKLVLVYTGDFDKK
ncbi:MAG: insulinase family protein [Bacteroidetes bacterium]|nr:insulinase family protein [Bacteroidota bacterium]